MVAASSQAEEEPKSDWARHSYRVLNLIDNQVRALRKRQVIDSFKANAADAAHRKGAYWGIRTNIADYELPTRCRARSSARWQLAETPTRLKRLDDDLQERLINWGYAVCDAALRKHVDPALAAPDRVSLSGRGEVSYRGRAGHRAFPTAGAGRPHPARSADDRRATAGFAGAGRRLDRVRDGAGQHQDLLITPHRDADRREVAAIESRRVTCGHAIVKARSAGKPCRVRRSPICRASLRRNSRSMSCCAFSFRCTQWWAQKAAKSRRRHRRQGSGAACARFSIRRASVPRRSRPLARRRASRIPSRTERPKSSRRSIDTSRLPV